MGAGAAALVMGSVPRAGPMGMVFFTGKSAMSANAR